MDELQRLDLVEEASIEVTQALGLELRHGEETDGVQSVIDGRDHDVGGLVDPVVERPVRRIAVNVAWRIASAVPEEKECVRDGEPPPWM